MVLNSSFRLLSISSPLSTFSLCIGPFMSRSCTYIVFFTILSTGTQSSNISPLKSIPLVSLHTSVHECCDKGVPKYYKCVWQLIPQNLGSSLTSPFIEQWHQTCSYEQWWSQTPPLKSRTISWLDIPFLRQNFSFLVCVIKLFLCLLWFSIA